MCQLFSASVTNISSETVTAFMKKESEDTGLLFGFSKLQRITVKDVSLCEETFSFEEQDWRAHAAVFTLDGNGVTFLTWSSRSLPDVTVGILLS